MAKLGKTALGATFGELLSIAHESNQLDQQRNTADSKASTEEVLSRREMLRIGGMATAGLALGNIPTLLEPLTANNSDARVVILGGGMAGLSAAYHLKRHGIKAQVYEAQPRVCGRIWTHYDVMGKGLVTEVGASFIDSVHTDMLQLAKTFGIGMWDTMAASEEKLQPAYFFEGRMRWNNDVLAAVKPFVKKIADDAKNATVNSYKDYNKLGYKLDHQSVEQYLKEIGVSGWLYNFFDVALMTENGTEISRMASSNAFGELGTNTRGIYDLFSYSDQRYHTKGGNQLIPLGCAERVPGQIHLQHWLESVRRTPSGAYELHFQTPAGPKTVTADYVINTIPFKILRELELDIPMPALKRKAIDELNYGDNCKLILGFDERFWRSMGTNGLFFTDLPIQSGWDSGWRQPTKESSLTLFFGGKSAIDQASIPLQARVEQYLPQIDQMYPGAIKHFTQKRTQFNWPHYKYIRASYTAYTVGQATTFGGMEPDPVDRMYFAGEHCDTDDQGFMNGAAKTGRLAAQAIIKAVR
jgi:monoamine oxidase